MNILITGAKGFIGKNLVCYLKNLNNDLIDEIFEYDADNSPADLDEYCSKADFVFHLAGVNRPKDKADFMRGNFGFSSVLLDTLKKFGNKCPVMLASSIQASLEGRFTDSEYGKSKKAGEDLFFEYANETGANVYVYRFPNVFGKWCNPNYNSAIATFCYNTANGLPIVINDANVELKLVYIDDVVNELVNALNGKPNIKSDGFCFVQTEYAASLGYIAETIKSFGELHENFKVPDLNNNFISKLYSTWLSYLPINSAVKDLSRHCDERGSFTELIKTFGGGQFSVNISKPNVTKGNHWHNSKNEKFVVVKGKALICLRNLAVDSKVEKIYVDGENLQIVDIMPGYVHSITNLSDTDDLITFMWANECFDPEKPDTYYEKV